MKQKFEPIADKCGEIVEYLMSFPGLSPQDEFALRLCSEEAVENVVSYAYEGGAGWLEAGIERVGDAIVISLRDSGTPFNPLAKPDPDITLSAEERPIGGLGIFLCKQMMDSVSYGYADGCNCLTMVKNIKTA